MEYQGGCYARQDSTVSSTPVVLTQSIWYTSSIKGVRAASVSVETADIRVTFDGTAPNNGSTPPVGRVITAGSSFTILGRQNIERFKAIKAGATDAVIHAEYFG